MLPPAWALAGEGRGDWVSARRRCREEGTTGEDRGAGSLIFKMKTMAPTPHQLISDAEPENDSRVVL